MKIQTFFETAGIYSCLACCYIYALLDYLGEEDKEAKINNLLFEAFRCDAGVDKEFFVYNPVRLITFCAQMLGKQITVNIEKKDEIPEKGYAAVRFDRLGKSHFVLYKDGHFLYNSLDFSYCFEEGKPTTCRIIKLTK